MSRQPAAPRVIRFGLFELDPSAGELHKKDRKIKLQEQPCQVLELLLRCPGEVVTREQLQQAIWPADTFVEFDQGLNTAIKKIRVALGDSADNPRFIETIPRKGYRFIAPVDGCQAEGAVPATITIRRRHLRWAIIFLVLAVGAGAGGWWLNRNRTAEQAYVPVPLTSYPGDERSPTFSPDGNQVAFSWKHTERRGVDHIYVKQVGADQPLQLTRDEFDDLGPAWSPDGRSIAFLRSLPNDRSGVLLIPVPGGPLRKVAEVWSPHGVESPYLAWHPNGKWLVVMDKAVPDEPLALFLLSVETGAKRRLTTPPQGIFFGDVGAAVSPDGRAVVFSRNNHDLFLQELSEDLNPKGQPKQLTVLNHYTTSPAWTANGRAIVFSSGTPHSPTLYNILLSQPGWRAGKPERLAFAGDGARQPAISRQGRLGFVRFTIDANIWRMQLNGGLPPALPPVKLIASTHLDHTPQYSPDGKRIAFASNRSGSHEIWVCNSDGSGIMQLTSFGGSYYTANPHWSPDGRQIYFASSADGKGKLGLYVTSSDGGRPERFTADDPTCRSRDGKWTYFDSSRSGEPQVWKIPALGGSAMQVTRKGGGNAQESPDGRILYYLKDGKEFTTLWKVPVSGGDETQVLESVCCSNFAVVDQGIYFTPEAPPGANSSLQFFSFATGKVTTLAQFSGLAAYGFSVSQDGRWLLYSQYEQKGADLMLVENFR